jgi:RimJ/RimL family protein N-acetyltransferase
VRDARLALGLEHAPAALASREDLFALALADLRVPPPLVDGRWSCRPQRPDELPLLIHWRAAYQIEALGRTPSPDVDERARSEMEAGGGWVLVIDERPCAYSSFNAELPDVVQVGGVYTPPELRGRGYARAAVAGSLVHARAHGVSRAILFTGEDNHPARTAYLALGFTVVGDYGLVLLS